MAQWSRLVAPVFLLTMAAVAAVIVSLPWVCVRDVVEEFSGSFEAPWLRGGSPADIDVNGKDHSVEFPTLSETMEMAKLSAIVYDFIDKDDHYCASFSNAEGVQCRWYFHDTTLGTQVMLVSNSKKKYLAVVFAGTDDLRTSLEDMNVAKKSFGNNSTVTLKDPEIKVHAGFDNAVFSGVYTEVSKRLKWLQLRHPWYRKVYTTGHSLGAANAILTATALAHEGQTVTSINFGCPRTGNKAWRDYLNSTSPLNSKLGIWRVVLGWDLVPRLPDFFEHVGHTIQMWSEDHEKYDKHSPDLIECYYLHNGDDDLGYASVPSGWYAKPYAWVPGAISYHHIGRYLEYLEVLSQQKIWVHSFKKLEPIGYDDDAYDEPPDDWYAPDSAYQIVAEETEKEKVWTSQS